MTDQANGHRNLPHGDTPPCYDLAIVGAGPSGLSTAFHAQQAGLSVIVIERGCVADNIRRYPTNLVFYSTSERIEIGDIPLITANPKPTRLEAVNYYTRFAHARDLNVRTYVTVTDIDRLAEGGFRLHTRNHVEQPGDVLADNVVLAFGAYDEPNRLGVPGEDLPHVSHFFDEPQRYFGRKVLIVGGKGSASEAALEIYRAGGQVALSYRRPAFTGLKYWIQPDLENRITEGEITGYLPSVVRRIERGTVQLEMLDTGEQQTLDADFVLALTGYAPTLTLFDALGVAYDEATSRPEYDPETHETNVPGVFVCGCICAGNIGNEIFIENGRAHGPLIAKTLAQRAAEPSWR